MEACATEYFVFALNIDPPENSYLVWGWDDPLLSSDLKRKIQKIKISVPAFQRYSSSNRFDNKGFPGREMNCVGQLTIYEWK